MPASPLRKFTVNLVALFTVVGFCVPVATAQRARQARGPGIVSKVVWNEDGKSVEFTNEGKRFKFDFESKEETEVESKKGGDRARPAIRRRRRPSQEQGNSGKYVGRPSRGRQYTKVDSPDGKWQAQYKDWNLSLIHI